MLIFVRRASTLRALHPRHTHAMLRAQDKGKPILMKPILVAIEDCYAVVLCARWFRLYRLKTREMPLPDPWHNVWNDCLNACKAAGLHSTILMVTLALNMPWGPWQGEKWFHQVIEGVLDWARISGKDDHIFNAYIQHVLRDLDMPYNTHVTEDLKKQLWEKLRTAEFLRKKGTKVALCRWFNWMNSVEDCSELWSLKTLCLIYVGLQLGFNPIKCMKLLNDIKTMQKNACTVVGTADSSAPSSAAAPVTMQQNKKETQMLRDRCKNTLHMVLMIHLQDSNINRARMIFHIVKPVKAWYSKGTHDVRSRSACMAFIIGMATGEGVLPSLCEVFRGSLSGHKHRGI